MAKGSLRQAINAHCKQCVSDELAGGTWREQVAGCQGVSCPLYPVRPRPSTGRAQTQARRPQNEGQVPRSA